MLEALGHILPIAVAVALSSVPIMATILILLSKNRNRSSIPFLIGWVLGLALVVVAFTLLAHAVPSSSPKQPQVALAIGQIVIGVALEVFAFVTWRRERGRPAGGIPKWLRAVASFGPWSSFGLGFILNLRPKALLLGAAAGLSLRGDSLTLATTVIVIVIYTVISASTVAIPIVATLVAPKKTEGWLVSTRAWIETNNRIVTILIMMMIGVVIIGNGLTRF
jgi:hypothetical protein